MEQIDRLPLRISRLLGWFLLLYVAFHLRELLEADSFLETLSHFFKRRYLTLSIFTGIAWFSYSLCAYLLLRWLYDRIAWPLLILLLLGSVVTCMFWRAFLEEVIAKAITGEGNYNPDMPWGTYLRDQILYALYFTPLGILFYFTQRSRFYEERRQEAEVLRVQSELKFLRSQVNPH
ncbi:MAG: hypothetical protein AAFZ52_10520, partial [Bacteroidota bacterium]